MNTEPQSELHHAVILVQRVFRGYRLRSHLAKSSSEYAVYYSNKIVRAYLAHFQRQRSLEALYARLCALSTKVKMAYRRYRLRLRVAERGRLLTHQRVQLLQSLYRGKLARRECARRRFERKCSLATKMASVGRGWLARKRCWEVRHRREEYASELAKVRGIESHRLNEASRDAWSRDRWFGFRQVLLQFLTSVDSAATIDSCLGLRRLHSQWLPATMLLEFLLLYNWNEYGKSRLRRRDLLEEALGMLLLNDELDTADVRSVENLEQTAFMAYFAMHRVDGARLRLLKAHWCLCFHTFDSEATRTLRLVRSSLSSNALSRFPQLLEKASVLEAIYSVCQKLGPLSLRPPSNWAQSMGLDHARLQAQIFESGNQVISLLLVRSPTPHNSESSPIGVRPAIHSIEEIMTVCLQRPVDSSSAVRGELPRVYFAVNNLSL